MQKQKHYILIFILMHCTTALVGTIMAQPAPDTSVVSTTDTSAIMLSWRLTDDYSKPKIVPVDTLLEGFEEVNPTLQRNNIFSNTGINGGPAINQVFYKRNHTSDFFVVNSSLPYLSTYENTQYYNARRPFTNMKYTTGVENDADNEETLHIIHTQNITQTLNVGGDYHLISSKGFYNDQPARKNSGRLFGNYLGEKYSLYASFNVNKHEVGENGGIVDSVFQEGEVPEDMQTRIPGEGSRGLTPTAKNTLRTRNLFLLQKYRFHQNQEVNDSLFEDQSFFNLELAHLLRYDVFAKYYEDALNNDFYENRHLNSSSTTDSLVFKKLSNTFRVEFNEARKYNVAVRADLTHEILYQRYLLYNDTANKYDALANHAILNNMSQEAQDEYMHFAFPYDLNKAHFDNTGRLASVYTSVALYNKIPREWDWIMNADYYLAGYKFGDFNLYGEVDRIFGKDSLLSLNLSANYRLKTPSPLYGNFYSNHFKWTNRSYQKENTLTLSGKLGMPKYNASVQFTQTNIYNHIYLNENVQPEQINRLVSINALELSHSIRKGIFRTQEYIVIQQSSDEGIIDLPLVSLKAKVYVVFPMLFNITGGRLDHVIGFSVRYNTRYYADAYMPALMSYYKQRDTQVGNYPYLDVFWNIKLKQVRFLLKYEHVNYGLLPKNYLLVPEYPQSPGMFKVGVAWTFYN